jgi:predicted GNAT family N-acyltransferase
VLIDAADPKLNILGYYTLSSYTIEIEYLDQSFAKNLPRYPQLPATLLGRLAIDNQQKGKGFGELMLLDALKKTLSASKQIASLAIIAEALDDSAVSFYLKYGFQKFIQNPMKLYLPIKSIEDILK